MINWTITQFILAFIPLFVAINPIALVPVLLPLVEGMSKRERRRTINIGTGTAAIVGVCFLLFGNYILKLIGISVGSFAIAGGIILLVLSIRYILMGRMMDLVREEMSAIVPIGTPLLAGPATITTLLLLVTQLHIPLVLLAFALNVLIAWGILLLSNRIVGFMGQGGLRAASKVFNLILAAIGVDMVINGLNLINVISKGT